MIRIISDTLTCISPEEAQRIGLGYIPQMVIFGNESYRDDTQMNSREFLRRLKASSSLPKTAAPPPAMYTPLYKEYSEKGDTIIVVCPTAEASGTFRSATVAAQDFPDADIRVVDTHLIAGGLGAVAKAALTWVDQGLDADTIVNKIQEMSNRNRTYFLVDTLEYLYKGGRIGAARALVGSLLQMKPILTFRNGHTEPFESQRTHRRALARMKEVILSDCPRAPEAHLCIMHGDAEQEANSLAAEFATLLDVPQNSIPIYEMTPAILVHSGPGVLAVSYFIG
jgi:DegV family protein with EDD domain